MMMLVTVAAMMAALLMALSGAALAQEARGGGDVCVSDRGETLIDIGASSCYTGPASQAVAVNDSFAYSDFDGGEALAVNHSEALAEVDSEAVAVNHSDAFAFDSCSATALNGEVERCP
jgi:hypothetical protein